jgi:hypothetical protein
MVNAWINHVKAYAKEHNLKYGDALKDHECKATYKKGSGIGGLNKVMANRSIEKRMMIQDGMTPPAIQPIAIKGMTRNGMPKPVNQSFANMTRYGKPGTFTNEDVARINKEDKEWKERRNNPTINSVTY